MAWQANTSARGGLRRWLQASGSLSARLATTGQSFSVQVLRQGRQPLARDEATALGLGAQRTGYAREVVLWVDNTPMVFARSVTAYRDSVGAWRSVRGLGSRPLADVLFRRTGILRQPLAFTRLMRQSPLQRDVARRWLAAGCRPDVPTALLARRSVFKRRGAGLLVMEVFAATASHWFWPEDASLNNSKRRRKM